MKKKLAIFTLAVGFFTLCNVVFYTRKLRADEMTTNFWHWSAQRVAGANCSLTTLDDLASCNVSGAISLVDNSHVYKMVNQSSSALGVTVAPSPSVHHPFQDDRRSSTYFVLDNKTHYLTVEGIEGTAVSTQVALPALNRTFRVTFNTSLFINNGISLRTVNGRVLLLATLAPSTVKNEAKVLTAPPVAKDETKPLAAPSVAENGTKSPALATEARNGTKLLAAPSVTKNATAVASSTGLTTLNRHPFSYLINVPDLCAGQSPLTLVILVTTAVNHFAHRKAIRETWGGFAKKLPNVRLAFVMGQPTDPAVQSIVLQEALLFADIVQEDFLDTYKNLTLKTVMLLRWVQKYCPPARFVMKSDDDVFINLSNLLKYIRSLRLDRKLLFGRLVKGARPLRSRSSKYFVPVTEYKDNVYPDYLSGTAYVMSGDVVTRLIHVAEVTPIFFFEDVFITGICAKKAGIARRNHSGFVYYKRQVKGCAYYRVISGHNNTPNDMRKIWKDLQRQNLKC